MNIPIAGPPSIQPVGRRPACVPAGPYKQLMRTAPHPIDEPPVRVTGVIPPDC
jgi:hypothetical protein